MASVRRIVVGLKTHEKSETVRLAKFLDCVVNHFQENELSAQVSCKLENDILLLYPPSQQGPSQSITKNASEIEMGNVTLQHSPECPIWLLSGTANDSLVKSPEDPGIHVGVALVVESNDQHILMTQRSDHMRSFPRAWVPPGGHIEHGETITQGGLRELEEETGLKLNSHNSKTNLLCLWESVYPVFLGMGSPKSHHVVVYLHTKVNDSWKELQTKIKIDPEEVQGWTWLSQDNVKTIRVPGSDTIYTNKYAICPNDGQIISTQLDLRRMFPSSMWGDRKIYSGSQMALNKWLELIKQTSTYPSKI